jgi:predicted amidohydrolase YtcJ
MNLITKSVLKLLLLISLGFIVQISAAEQAVKPSVIYTNGIIWTGADELGIASAMVVTDGKISYIGNAQPSRVDPVKIVDLKGKFVTPGLIDNHTHFIEGGAGLAGVQLRDATTPEQFSNRIIDYAEGLKAGQWVQFGNWDHENWGGLLPDKSWIDEQTKDNPVLVMRIDGHMGFANSAALKLAGIDADSVAPAGGEIERDQKGEPTGILKDTALNAVFKVIPKPSDEELLDAINTAQSHALSLGLTKVHVMVANPGETNLFEAFKLADQQGLLKIRVAVYTPIEAWQEEITKRQNQRYVSERLSWGGLKGLTDGALGSTTAWFYDPYSDAKHTSGLPIILPEQLQEMVDATDAKDIRLAIHAIGDRSIDAAIQAMKNSAGDDIKFRRFRIEHFQHPTKDAIEAAAKHGIIASMQPYHAVDDGRWAEKRIGAERIKTTYAFNSILAAGGILSFGSDWPVAPLSPLQGIHAAVTRKTLDGAHPDGWLPQEKITVEQALIAYTATNAYAGFEESIAGSLEPGKRADFVVFDQDLRTIDPDSIKDVKVKMTVINGRVEYQR